MIYKSVLKVSKEKIRKINKFMDGSFKMPSSYNEKLRVRFANGEELEFIFFSEGVSVDLHKKDGKWVEWWKIGHNLRTGIHHFIDNDTNNEYIVVLEKALKDCDTDGWMYIHDGITNDNTRTCLGYERGYKYEKLTSYGKYEKIKNRYNMDYTAYEEKHQYDFFYDKTIGVSIIDTKEIDKKTLKTYEQMYREQRCKNSIEITNNVILTNKIQELECKITRLQSENKYLKDKLNNA